MQLPTDYLEQLRAEYPRRDGDNGWLHVRSLVPRAITMGATWARILKGTRAYKIHCDRKGLTGSELVKQARTFFGRDQWWEEWCDMAPVQTPQQLAQAARWVGLKARSAAIGFRDPTAMESCDVYETVLRRAEREYEDSTGSRRAPIARNIPNVINMLAKAKAV